MAGKVTTIPMGTPILNIPARVDKDHTSSVSGGLTVGRDAETVAKTASRMEVERIRLEAFSLFGLAYTTEEILADSPISFAAILAAGFSDEFTSVLINERLNGIGVGQFTGINNSGSLITITKETGQAAATIVYQNVLKMRQRCWGYDKAQWLANHDCLPQLAQMNMSVGTGGIPIWMPSAREDVPDMLLGRPLVFSEYPAAIGSAGDLLCCNWSQFIEGTYQPLQSAESIHVRFLNHERAFKFWLRNAGACWWRATLTPKHGATRSPFIALGARA